MQSPKEYLEATLSRVLGEYVEDYDGSDFSFGLWQGNVILRNLMLKPMTINIGDGMVSRMIFGSIDRLQVIIPWSQISSGHVTVAVDTVNVIVQLSVDQSADDDHKATDTLLHKMKMAQLESEERKLLGVTESSGWKTRMMEGLRTSLLSKLFNGITAEVNNLRVSFILPLSLESQVAHVQLLAESISINRKEMPASDEFEQIIGKGIDVRGVAVCTERVKIFGELDPQMLLERQPGELILNPMYCTSDVRLLMSPAGVMDVQLAIKLRNTEVTLNFSQLQLIREILVYNSGESMKYAFRHLRPHVPVITNPRLWWQFAAKAVIRLMRHRDGGDSLRGSASSWAKRESLITLRRRYQELYKKHLENRLLTLRYPDEYARFVKNIAVKPDLTLSEANVRHKEIPAALVEKWQHMKSIEEQMDELHTCFSANDILLYRAAVRQRMRKDRSAISQALYSTDADSVSPSWFSFFNSPFNISDGTSAKNSKDRDIEQRILQLCREFDRTTIAGLGADARNGNAGFVLDISLSVPRIALCVSSRGSGDSEDDQSFFRRNSRSRYSGDFPSHYSAQNRGLSSNRRGESEDVPEDQTMFTVALYGLNVSFTKDQHQDMTVQIKIGSVRGFGLHGINIMTIGSTDTDVWLQSGSTDGLYAIESSFQWRQRNYLASSETGIAESHEMSDSDAENNHIASEVDAYTKLLGGLKVHCVVVITVSSVKLRWDEPTHALCSRLNNDMTSEFLYLNKTKLFVSDKAACAQLSINKSSLMDLACNRKYSAEINVQGIVFECPCVDPSVTDSGFRRSTILRWPDHSATDAPRGKRHFIRVIIRSFKVSGGDFLPKTQSYAKLEETLHSIPTRSLWPSVDGLVEILLGKLNCSVVHPFVYSLNATELQFVTATKKTAQLNHSNEVFSANNCHEEVIAITGSPWSIACVVSPCDILAHPIFPALRLDVFSSPLQLRLSMEKMPSIVRTIYFLVSYMIPLQEPHLAQHRLSPLQIPRIKNLAPLCKYRFNFHLDYFDFRINTTNRKVVSSTLLSPRSRGVSFGEEFNGRTRVMYVMRDVLIGLVETITMCGQASVAAVSKTRLCQQRLRILSKKPIDVVTSVVNDLVHSIGREDTVSSDNKIDVAVGTLMQSNAEIGADTLTELFGASISGIHCSVYSLTYDRKVTVQLEEATITDCDGYSVCYVKPVLDGQDEAVAMASHLYQFGDGTMTMGAQHSTYTSSTRRLSSPFRGETELTWRDKRSRRREILGRRPKRDSSRSVSTGRWERSGSNVRSHRNRRKGHHELDAETIVQDQAGQSHSKNFAACCGLVITFLEQDKNAGWGVGGGKVYDLYKASTHGLLIAERDAYDTVDMPFRMRENEISVDIKSIDSVLSPNGLTRFASDVVPIFILSYPLLDRANRDDEKDNESDCESPALSEYSSYDSRENSRSEAEDAVRSRFEKVVNEKIVANSWCCYLLSIETCHIDIVVNEKMLAAVDVRHVDVEWRQTQYLYHNRLGILKSSVDHSLENIKKWLSSSHRFSVGAVYLFDVSEEGRRHVEVLWKDLRSSERLLLITGLSTERQSSFNISLNGIRCTFLWRFLWEIVDFSLNHLYVPIAMALESCVQTVSERQRVESNADGFSLPPMIHDIESKRPLFQTPGQQIFNAHSNAEGRAALLSPDSSDHSDSDGGSYVTDEIRSKISEAPKESADAVLNEEFNEKVETFWARMWKTRWVLTLHNTTIVLPRNSRSEDVACICVKFSKISNHFVFEPWSPPPGVGNNASADDTVKNAMYFDIIENSWLWKKSADIIDENQPSLKHLNSLGSKTFIEINPSDGLVLLPDDNDTTEGRSRLSTEGSCMGESRSGQGSRLSSVPFSQFETNSLKEFSPSLPDLETAHAESGDSSDFESCYASEGEIQEIAHEEQTYNCEKSSVALKLQRESMRSSTLQMPSTNYDSDEFYDARDHISLSSEEDMDLLRQYYSDTAVQREVRVGPGDSVAGRTYPAYSEACDETFNDADDWTMNTGGEDASENGPVFRLRISLVEAHLYTSIAGPLSHYDDPQPFRAVNGDKKFAEVKHDGHVYVGHMSNHSSNRSRGSAERNRNKQVWKNVSTEPFNLQIVVDTTDIQQKWLMTDTEQASPLSLNCTMAELYLLLSIYFDNMAETTVFFENVDTEVPDVPHRVFPTHPEYGTKFFWEYVRMRTAATEFLFSREFFKIDCSLEPNMFPIELPCLSFINLLSKTGQHTPGKGRKHEPLPFAELSLFKTVLHCKVDSDVTQVAFSCGGLEVRDTRSPITTLFPVVLSVFPLENSASIASTARGSENERKTTETNDFRSAETEIRMVTDLSKLSWGVADFDFGLKIGSRGVSSVAGTPLTVTYYGIGNTWSSSNIGIDAPSFDIKNLDIVYLVDEYFSMYFRNAIFGHPGLVAYSKISKELWPYGGVDTRVFVTRPHIQMPEYPLSSNTQILVVSAEKGLYFRYLYDSEESLRMDCTITGLSAVLLKSHRPPVVARSYRGSAGSGKGVRSLIESVHFSWNYHYYKPKHHLDISLSISPVKLVSPARRWENIPSQNRRVFTAPKKKISPSPEHRHATGANPLASTTFGGTEENTGFEDLGGLPFVDFDEDRLAAKLPPFYTPKTVLPLISSTRSHNVNYAYFVSSYVDVLLTTALIMDFLGLPNIWTKPVMQESDLEVERNLESDESSTEPPASLFAIVRVVDAKVILVDDVLGLHLPIFQGNMSEISVCYHRSPVIKTALFKDIVENEMMNSAEASARERALRRKSTPVRNLTKQGEGIETSLPRSNSNPPTLHDARQSRMGTKPCATSAEISKGKVAMHTRLYGNSNLGVDYFNNIKKCWEPLIAPFALACLYEESESRGQGVTLRFTSALRLNVSVALVRTLHDALRVVQAANETARGEYYANEVDHGFVDANQMHHKNDRRGSLDCHSMASVAASGHLNSRGSGSTVGNSDYDNELDINLRRTTVSTARRELALADERKKNPICKRTYRYNHVPTQSLRRNARVGFSIFNLTGQPLRYVQFFSSTRATMVHYLEHNQRGLLNFVASKTTIRNNQVVEEQFGHFKQETLQRMGQKALKNPKRRPKEVGHHIAVQICGYKWLSSLQADALGIHFKDLHAILGCLNATTIANDAFKKKNVTPGPADGDRDKETVDWRTTNALKLVAEVRPHNGGRMLLLRSAFAVKNSTTHDINAITNFSSKMPDPPLDGGSDHFLIKSGETFFIPLALINESVLRSHAKKTKAALAQDKGTQLGCLWVRPSSILPVRKELGPSSQFVKSMSYSGDPIVLKNVVSTLESNQHSSIENSGYSNTAASRSDGSNNILISGNFKQLSCTLSTRVTDARGYMFDDFDASDDGNTVGRDGSDLNDAYGFNAAPVVNSDKLPPFCYNIEVQTSGSNNANSYTESNDRTSGFMSMFAGKSSNQDDAYESPLQYTIVIHPPIVLENLLPMKGIFELIHATHKTVLWSSVISPGQAIPVHTVTLDVPIMLVIILDFCRSAQGLLVHKPAEIVREEVRFADKLQQTIEGFLEEDEDSGTSSIMLSDSVGQRLRLLVENNVGGGGQRNIVIFCPYWLVNTSQYTIRLREDGGQVYPAGTVTSQRDGTRPIISGSHLQGSLQGGIGQYGDELSQHGPVFLGRPGPLHSTRMKEISNDSSLRKYLHEMKFEDICALATLFNFLEDAHILGSRKVVAQLDESKWSRSFTLDSAGVAQVLSVEQQDKGLLELAFKVSNGPGRLANYTKVIRFLPRFVVLNKLPRQVTLMQTNGLTYDDTKMAEVSADHLTPFHLPSVFSERQVSLQLEGPWMRSVLFDADHVGTHTFTIKPEINFEKLHVNTRGAPVYNVTIDPGEVGLYFETDWGAQDVIVKKVKPGSFAARKTDIQPGDVLIAIDAEEIDGSDFEGTMAKLKAKQAGEGCVLKFLTIEAKLQNIRGSAMSTAQGMLRHESVINIADGAVNPNELEEISVRLEMRPVDATIFMILSEFDKNSRPEYRIENDSACHVIEYKQKGAAIGTWETLLPGNSASYIWDNPYKPHKLLVRVVKNLLCPTNNLDIGANQTKKQKSSQNHQSGSNEQMQYHNSLRKQRAEDMTLSVHLDDIKWHGVLHLPSYAGDGKLVAKIQSEGMTKILKVSMDNHTKFTEYKYSHDFAASQIDSLDILKLSVGGLRPNQLQKSISIDHLQSDQTHTPMMGLSSFHDVLALRLKQSFDEIQNLQSRLLEAQRCLLDTDISNLASVTSFESVLGTTITKQDQIIVEVLGGKKLKAMSYGSNLESYCEVYLKGSLLKSGWFPKKYMTTICDGTTDPTWTDQVFVFDVPVLPSDSIRGNSVRINVKTKNLLGDNWVGQTDIQLASLVHENVLTGWFPLRPHKAAIAGAPYDELQHNGSIKLRVEWVHSNEALKKHYDAAIKKRRDELAGLLASLEISLGRMLQSRANIPRRSKYFEPEAITKQSSQNMNDVLQQLKYMNNYVSRKDKSLSADLSSRKRSHTSALKLLALASESSRNIRDSKKKMSKRNLMYGVSNISLADDLSDLEEIDVDICDRFKKLDAGHRKSPPRNKVLKSSSSDNDFMTLQIEEPSTPVVGLSAARKHHSSEIFVRPDELHPFCASSGKKYLQLYHAMTKAKEGINAANGSNACVALVRRDDVIVQENNYKSWFDEESNRNYMNILSMAGVVEITAVQALHLPVSNRPVFVKMSYGGETARTSRTPPTAHPAWENEDDISPHGDDNQDIPDHANRRHNHGKAFSIDAFNSKGVFHISVMVDDFPNNKEIAKLDISVFNLLDCIATLDTDEVYDMWFPLSLTQDTVRTDGDIGGSFTSWSSEKKASHQFGYHACIRLLFKWKPSRITALSLAGHKSSDFYARIQLPYLSVAVIDSIRVREVFQIIISDVEARHTSTNAISESSLTVQWLQVDNQLPNPIALVILAPTPSKYPQPILRFYIKRNHMLSHKNLQCFDVIELIVQALDLRLEQETVMALWDVVKSCRQERKATESQSELEENEVGRIPIDKMGFSSCMDAQSTEFLPTFSRAEGKEKAVYQDDMEKIYVDRFQIGPMKINVSFIMTPSAVRSSNRVVADSHASMSQVDDSGLYAFFWQVGEVVLDLTSTISDAPIRLGVIQADNVFKTWSEFTSTLQSHYLSSALGQMYKIVGSLDLVGNPVGLLSSLGTGVKDFFYEPGHALITSPTEISKIGRGVVKGTVSLLVNTSDGFIGTATTMTRSFGKGIAALSMDKAFLRNREALQRHPNGIVATITRPAKDIANGFYCGVIGIVRVPYHSVKTHGCAGLLPGIAKGLAGVPAKPVVGVLDALTHSGDALRDLVKELAREPGEPAFRRSLCNLFGPDGRLMPFSFEASYGSYVLRVIDEYYKEKLKVKPSKRQSFLKMNQFRPRAVTDGISDNALNKRSNSLASIDEEPYSIGEASSSCLPLFQRSRYARAPASMEGDEMLATSPGQGTADDDVPASYRLQNSKKQKPSGIRDRSGLNYVGGSQVLSRHRAQSGGDIYRQDKARINFVNETVVYTAVVSRGPAKDTLVIVTNCRVVVAVCRWDAHGIVIDCKWDCDIARLKKPVLKNSGGGSVILLLTATATRIAEASAADDFLESISGDNTVILHLFNCLNTVLLHFSAMNTVLLPAVEGDRWREDIYGIIHIGPWEYSRQVTNEIAADTSDRADGEEDVMTDLEELEWAVPPGIVRHRSSRGIQELSVPTWLSEYCHSSCAAHSRVRRFDYFTQKGSAESESMRLFRGMLQTGKIDGDEFTELMKADALARDNNDVIGNTGKNLGRYQTQNEAGVSSEDICGDDDTKHTSNFAKLTSKFRMKDRRSRSERNVDSGVAGHIYGRLHDRNVQTMNLGHGDTAVQRFSGDSISLSRHSSDHTSPQSLFNKVFTSNFKKSQPDSGGANSSITTRTPATPRQSSPYSDNDGISPPGVLGTLDFADDSFNLGAVPSFHPNLNRSVSEGHAGPQIDLFPPHSPSLKTYKMESLSLNGGNYEVVSGEEAATNNSP